MPATADMLTDALRRGLDEAIAQVNALVLGKPLEIRLAFAALLSGGHLVIEDQPGLGKTTLAHALAVTLGLHFERVQFTSDLMPSDILGVSVYDAGSARFEFHPGPVFAQVLLADEINRAPPRTQSALLEAMSDRQVSIDGKTYELPPPFFVIATQNPYEFEGTYVLPESQLDRFMIRIRMGHRIRSEERRVLVRPAAVDTFAEDVGHLRDDVERTAKRIARLEQKLEQKLAQQAERSAAPPIPDTPSDH